MISRECCSFPNFFGRIGPVSEGHASKQKIATFAVIVFGLIGLAMASSGTAAWGGLQEWWDAGVLTEMGTVCSLSIAGVGFIVTIVDIGIILGVNLCYEASSDERTKIGGGIQIDPMDQSEEKLTMHQRLALAIDEGRADKKTLLGEWKGVELIDDSSLNETIRAMRTDGLESHEGTHWGVTRVPNLKRSHKEAVEDAYCFHEFRLKNGTKVQIYGVFDGHKDRGYWAVNTSGYICRELPARLEALQNKNPNTIEAMLKQLSLDCQNAFREETPSEIAGTTAVYALMIGDLYYIANVGDSRAVLIDSDKSQFYQLSEDAKLENPRVQKAVLSMGHEIWEDGRVHFSTGYNTNIGNDIGNEQLPTRTEVTSIFKGGCMKAEEHDDGIKLSYQIGNYLVLATDGFTDACSNSELAETIQALDKLGRWPDQIAQHLAYAARLVAENLDDITVLVIRL